MYFLISCLILYVLGCRGGGCHTHPNTLSTVVEAERAVERTEDDSGIDEGIGNGDV